MEATIIRKKLHQFIDTIEDKKAAAIYTLLENEIDTDAQRKSLIASERTNYLNNEGQTYNWEDVKKMAINKSERHGL